MNRAVLKFAGLTLMSLALQARVIAQAQGGPDQQVPVDEAGRAVARVSLVNGDASVRRGDSGDWVAATPNAPLMVEDSVSVGPGGYAEVQFDQANFLRVAGDSEARISTLENGRYGVQVIKGMVTFRVLRQTNSQAEVATPQVAVRPGQYSAIRVELLADGYSRIEVRAGDADVFTPQGVEKVRTGSMMMVRGSASEPEYQIMAATAVDEWDHFNQKRDQDLLATKSNQYVSQDIYGAEDLDRNGEWVNDPQYGNVWAPRVAADWAPYRSGRWVWEDYYGWTWVASESWGWAPYHYGSWYHRGAGFGWCWYPGPIHSRYFWRPALVAFFGFGGGHGGLGFGGGYGGGLGGGIGWVPLAPREAFHPWYGRGWYGGRSPVVNNVTFVNNTNITSIYRNARVREGVSGLNAQEFASGRFHSIRSVDSQNLQSTNLVRGALPMQPSRAHLGFSDRPVSNSTPRVNPPQRGFTSHLDGRSTQINSPTQRTPFAQQQSSFANLNRVGQQSPQQSNGGQQSNGWRRFGNPNSAPNAYQNNSSQTGSSQSGMAPAQGWQRFGSPQSNGGNRSSAPSQTWNSFGRPSGAPETPRNQAPRWQSQPEQNATPRYQQRSTPQYDAPRRASPQYSAPEYRAPQNNAPTNNLPQYNSPRPAAPQYSQPRNNYAPPSAPRYSGSQESRGNQGRSLQVAPPMVQQRSSESYGRPGNSGGGGGRQGGGERGGEHSSGHSRR